LGSIIDRETEGGTVVNCRQAKSAPSINKKDKNMSCSKRVEKKRTDGGWVGKKKEVTRDYAARYTERASLAATTRRKTQIGRREKNKERGDIFLLWEAKAEEERPKNSAAFEGQGKGNRIHGVVKKKSGKGNSPGRISKRGKKELPQCRLQGKASGSPVKREKTAKTDRGS